MGVGGMIIGRDGVGSWEGRDEGGRGDGWRIGSVGIGGRGWERSGRDGGS